MRRKLLAGLILGMACVLLVAMETLTAVNIEARLGPAPGDVRAVKSQINLSAMHYGMIVWSGLYETDQPVLVTWRRYPRLGAMELEEGVRSTDQCLRLMRDEQFFAIGRTTTGRLCAGRNGTLIYLYQRFYLRPIGLW